MGAVPITLHSKYTLHYLGYKKMKTERVGWRFCIYFVCKYLTT